MARCCKCKIELEVGKIGYCRVHRDASSRNWYLKHKKERKLKYKNTYIPIVKIEKEIITCKICKKKIEKTHYKQLLCGDSKCVKRNKKIYNKKYRKHHPEYFKKYLFEYRKK